MKILLVQPRTPATFWSFHHAVRFVGKKASQPPLGLLTVAAMLPKDWHLKLVDMNVSRLRDKDLRFADYVFLTGMNIHFECMKDVIHRCHLTGTKVVLGGPLCTLDPGLFEGVDHYILNEAEQTLPQFVADVQNGTPCKVYTSNEFPSLAKTPVPMWSLINLKKYASMVMQYSRGCPYNCEFCGISRLNGHVPRTKQSENVVAELDALYSAGWRGGVFIVDDNFIGNRKKLKQHTLPAIQSWMKARHYPFKFMTEVSINLADDAQLQQQMVQAGFDSVFIGIETPSDDGLSECGKKQNQHRDLVQSVKTLQHSGLVVSAGFIVGFDSDPLDIFDRQIRFIQESGIATAMVGLLNAPTGTQLYSRMKKEHRLLGIMSGDNMDASMNFIPKMSFHQLKDGYNRILRTIYSPRAYFLRVKTLLRDYRLPAHFPIKLRMHDIRAFVLALWILGIVERGRAYFWKLVIYCMFTCPKKLPLAVTLAIYGFHFRCVTNSLS
ncbi:MAG: DUF4070 domain-containing protein [Deltaproteobacteria bacterium]|nr:DUF4070 domain-containing protein [Deltaproteobacteria bacterium]